MAEIEEVFSFDSFSVRTLKIGEDVFFNGQDVAASLGFRKTRNAIQTYVADKHKILHKRPEPGRSPIYISEPAMYKFALQCRMPVAERFCDWVTDEVLVSIRKTGRYELAPQQFKAIADGVDRSTPNFREYRKNAIDLVERTKDQDKVEKGRRGGRACQENIRGLKAYVSVLEETLALKNELIKNLEELNSNLKEENAGFKDRCRQTTLDLNYFRVV